MTTQSKRKRQFTLAVRNNSAKIRTEYVFHQCESEIDDIKDMMFYIHDNVLAEDEALKFVNDAGHSCSKIDIIIVEETV